MVHASVVHSSAGNTTPGMVFAKHDESPKCGTQMLIFDSRLPLSA